MATINLTQGEQSRMQALQNFAGQYVDTNMIRRLAEYGYFLAPAAIKHHGNYEGGLFEHSFEVAKQLVRFTKALDLTWEKERSPYIVGLFHDLCKLDDYVLKDGEWIYNPDRQMSGHGDKSVILLQKLMPLTWEEIICVRWHMGAFDEKDNWQYYSRACRCCPNVLYTHTADMVASQIVGV